MSVPIYTLASSNVPITIIKHLEQLIINFLWHSQGEKRIHWIYWDYVCRPKEEGGLGIRRLSDIQRCLHRMLMCMVLKGDTFWGRFAQTKYFRGHQFVKKSVNSPLWDSIVSHENCLRSIGQWVVGHGDVSFWNDNWLGTSLGGPLPFDIQLIVHDALTLLEQFRPYIPAHLEGKIQQTFISPQVDDQLYFTISEKGLFLRLCIWGFFDLQDASDLGPL